MWNSEDWNSKASSVLDHLCIIKQHYRNITWTKVSRSRHVDILGEHLKYTVIYCNIGVCGFAPCLHAFALPRVLSSSGGARCAVTAAPQQGRQALAAVLHCQLELQQLNSYVFTCSQGKGNLCQIAKWRACLKTHSTCRINRRCCLLEHLPK